MQALQHIYQAVSFIEENLKEPITVKAVAEATGFSLYYFIRQFAVYVGHSPYDYIMRRRLTEVAKLLMTSRKNIIDIALEYQFNNPEAFSRAFCRMFGMLPSQLRKQNTTEKMIYKSACTYEYLQHIHKGPCLRPELMLHDAIYLIGLSTWDTQSSRIDALAEKLQREAVLIADLVLPEKYYIISTYATHHRDQAFTMLAVETTSVIQVPGLMVSKIIPPMSYARFTHKGTYSELAMTYDYIYQTWLPRSGHHLATPYLLHYVGTSFKELKLADTESSILLPIN